MKKKLNFSIIFVLILLLLSPKTSAADPSILNIESPSVILIHNDTGKVLYSKETNKKMYPASTAKIMTALLVLESDVALSDVATVSYDAVVNVPVGYSHANLQVGEQLTIEDLLNVILIPSANDAANVLAEHVSGSVENFVELMNAKAIELGCTDTNFVNPNGIHSDEQITTTHDLSLIAQYAMKNETFRSFVSKTSCSLPITNKYDKEDRVFTTTNDLIKVNNSNKPDNYYYKYANGIKTGYTSQARNCIVASAQRDGLEFIVVILGAVQNEQGISQRYSDCKNLFEFAFENYTTKKIKEKDSILKEVEIKNATKDTRSLSLVLTSEINVLIDKQDLNKNILPEIILNENLEAPITKGETVGSIKYIVENVEYTSELIAGNAVKKESVFALIFKIFLVFLALYIIYSVLLKPTKRKKRKSTINRKQNYGI